MPSGEVEMNQGPEKKPDLLTNVWKLFGGLAGFGCGVLILLFGLSLIWVGVGHFFGR